MTTSSHSSRRAFGAHIESLVQRYLERCGLHLLTANYLRRMGEIDLVFEDDNGCIVFVEVRYRHHQHYGGGTASVDSVKASKLRKTARAFLQQYSLTQRCARIDVVSVSLKRRGRSSNSGRIDSIEFPVLSELDMDWIKNAVEG